MRTGSVTGGWHRIFLALVASLLLGVSVAQPERGDRPPPKSSSTVREARAVEDVRAARDERIAQRPHSAGTGPDRPEKSATNREAGPDRPEETRPPERPNILLILADDLDTRSVRYMPRVRRLLAERGTTFENAFVTDPLCCPARATILRGQYAHNHRVLSNAPPLGGFPKFRRLGRERSTVATWLQDAGYRTVLVGKYLNQYEDAGYVPPGWDEWYGLVEPRWLSVNGEKAEYDPERRNMTDVLANRATDYARRAAKDPRPFFMYLAPRPPHAAATPTRRHRDEFSKARLPRPPSFGEKDLSDKPRWVRQDASPLGPRELRRMNGAYRERLRTLLDLDEMVGRLVETLRRTGELENTYVVFTSDNGYHMGQHGLPAGKLTPYEEDVRVPLIVRGPGVPAGRTLPHLVLGNDLAPTFADLGGADAPPFVDGRSLAPLLRGEPPEVRDWRSAFLIEKFGSAQLPSYRALRTRDFSYVEYSTGEREFYDLRTDPYQLRNRYAGASPERKRKLASRLEALRDCARAACRRVEGGMSRVP